MVVLSLFSFKPDFPSPASADCFPRLQNFLVFSPSPVNFVVHGLADKNGGGSFTARLLLNVLERYNNHRIIE